MDPKRSKYDTNPLDKDVVDRATESFESGSGSQTHAIGEGITGDVRRTASQPARMDPESEAPTRRIDPALADSYPSVFVKPPRQSSTTYEPPRAAPPAHIYQPPPVPPPGIYQRPPGPVALQDHTVAGMGISQKWVNLLPYIPGHIGAVAAVIELLLVPRVETRARFHAAQGLALQIAILIIAFALGLLTAITDNSIGSGIFRAASTVYLIISMVRVYQGKAHHIAPLEDATRWLDEKIKPRK